MTGPVTIRKKPVEVRAIRYTGENAAEVIDWAADIGAARVPHQDMRCLVIPTLEGSLAAKPGDWIIAGVELELYPCDAGIFAKTYDIIGAA